jgi:hypothetical protein
MDGFQVKKVAAGMPYVVSSAEQLSPDATRWKRLQVEIRPD